MLRLLIPIIFLFSSVLTAQKNYAVSTISSELRHNSSAVIRVKEVIVNLDNFDEMTVIRKEVITVFNRKGLIALDPTEPYDASSIVKSIEDYLMIQM